MYHDKVIHDVITKYEDQPGVQDDLRKLLHYVESQQRMFLKPFIKGTASAPTPQTTGSIVESYPKRFRPHLKKVINSMAELAATAATNSLAAAPGEGMTTRQLVAWLVNQHYAALSKVFKEFTPPRLRDDLVFFAAEIVNVSAAKFTESVDDLLDQLMEANHVAA